jgi:hypothetical protein
MAVPRFVKLATATVQNTSTVTTNVMLSGKIFIRQQILAKTQFVTATTTTAPKIFSIDQHWRSTDYCGQSEDFVVTGSKNCRPTRPTNQDHTTANPIENPAINSSDCHKSIR